MVIQRIIRYALSLALADKEWVDTQEVLEKRYGRFAKRMDQIKADDVFETFMNAFAHTLDPHSSYLSPRNSEEYRIQMSLSYFGIGGLYFPYSYTITVNVTGQGSVTSNPPGSWRTSKL